MIKIGSFWVIFGAKIVGWYNKFCSFKSLKNYVSRVFFYITVVINVINRVNLVKICHFWCKLWNVGHFLSLWGKNDVIGQIFGWDKNYYLNCLKNYLSHVYWHNCCHKRPLTGQFCQNRSLLEKMVILGAKMTS